MTTDPIYISLSKGKLIRLLILSIMFLAGGSWLLIAQPQTDNPVFNSVIIKNLAGGLCVMMALLGIVFFSRKLADKRPGLIVDTTGITDNSGAMSLGFIPWADITAVESKTIQVSAMSKQKFVAISLRNPEEYIARETSAIKRKAMSIGLQYSDSPVNISPNGLKIKYEDLLQLLQEKYREYK